MNESSERAGECSATNGSGGEWQSDGASRACVPPPSSKRGERATLSALLQAPTSSRPAPDPAGAQLVAFCVDTQHPSLLGRVLVRWSAGGDPSEQTHEHWLPCLQHVVAREGDRLLLAEAANFDERIVVGVLDGFARRPNTPRSDAAAVEVQPDERLMVRCADGTPLVEVHQEEAGPVVQVLSATTHVKLPGTFKLEADALELRASRGPVRIQASDDVNVDGEMIHLNSPRPSQQPVGRSDAEARALSPVDDSEDDAESSLRTAEE